MKPRLLNYPLLYQEALRSHLEQGGTVNLESAVGLGSQALAFGISTLGLAKLHEKTVVTKLLPDHPPAERRTLIRHAGQFFAAVIAPLKSTSDAGEAARLRKIIGTLSDRTVELSAANQELSLEIEKRKEVETSLKSSERRTLKALENANLLKEQLRELSRRVLAAQEDERKKISRELHDVVAQALMGINVRLATLKTAAGLNSQCLDHSIALTQKMVTKSASIVHRFARELRPTALDDLGLLPTLLSFMKNFTTRTGIHTHLAAFAGVERLDATRRTVLYRVAQEALTNVALHARASRVRVSISREDNSVRMEVSDNGRSFDVHQVLRARDNKRLGLLGMRERVGMVGGVFEIESAPDTGTRVIARLPVTRTTARKWELEALEEPGEPAEFVELEAKRKSS